MTEAEIFGAAIELPPEERSVYLDRVCGNDTELRARVEELLKLSGDTDGFMQQPAIELAELEPVTARPGSQLGPYTLIEQIGEGGFGLVFRATQTEPVQRTVAIKLLKRGMDSKAVLKRFELERQSLAAMNHSGIAQVFDAGISESGQHYFVMEFVAGSSITEYANAQAIDSRDRLALFAQVCDAVAHAHQKGILHRDIKPSNVLVTEVEDRPQVKVIDFGIAKAIGASAQDATQITQSPIMMGTPQYMSPEQAAGSVVVDTRTDVYAMGVLLYELLTGRLPFEPDTLRRAALDEIFRIIREEDPPKPSTKLSSISEPDQAAIAKQRSTEPRSLIRMLRQELEWIPLKAMRKEPDHRYAGASAMGDDIRNYLAGNPLIAGPESRIYRIKKLANRYRWPVATGMVILSLLIGGISATSWYYLQASREAKRSTDVLQIVTDAFGSVDPNSGADSHADMTAKEVLLNARDSLENSELDDKGRVELLRRLAVCFRALGEFEAGIDSEEEALQILQRSCGEHDIRTLESMNHVALMYTDMGRYDEALALNQKTLKLKQVALGKHHEETLASMSNLALAYEKAGRLDEAVSLNETTLALKKSTLGEHHLETLASMNNLAATYASMDRLEDAVAIQEKQATLVAVARGKDHQDALMSANNLALMYLYLGRYDESLELNQRTLEIRKIKLGEEHPDTLQSMSNLALVYYRMGKFKAALPINERTLKLKQVQLGADHPDTLTSMNNLADTYRKLGRDKDALELHKKALQLRTDKLGEDHPQSLRSMHSVATAYANAGRLDDALELRKQSVQLHKVKYGEDDPDTLKSMHNLASTYRKAGRFDEGLAIREKQVELIKKKLGEDHLHTLISMTNLAILYAKVGRLDEARALDEATLELKKSNFGEHNPETLTSMNNLATVYRDLGRLEDALALQEEVVEVVREKLAGDHPLELLFMTNQALIYEKLGRLDDAVALFEETLALSTSRLGESHRDTLWAMSDLANAYVLVGRLDEAKRLLEKCLAGKQKQRPDDWTTFDTQSLLGGVLLQLGQPEESAQPLTEGYQGLARVAATIPATSRREALKSALERLILLAETQEHAAEAAKWQARLAELPKEVSSAPSVPADHE